MIFIRLILFVFSCLPIPLSASPLDTSYTINRQAVTLKNGVSEKPAAADSAARIITRVWGKPVTADVNADGKDDQVLWLTQSTGGSGTFFYVAVAIADENGYLGSQGLFIGDRIKPVRLQVIHGNILVRFKTRSVSQSFVVTPAIEKQMQLVYQALSNSLAPADIDHRR